MEVTVMGLILAGGKGTRLSPLTSERAKPAVPFGGKYRIVDFVLSNFINSGIHSIYVLIQFKSQSLLQHLSDGWQFGGGLLQHQFIIPVPAQMRIGDDAWYRGTADAVYQNLNLVEQSKPDLVVLFGADHIYRMDIRQMVRFHLDKNAGVTVAVIPVEKRFAKDFGVIEVDHEGRILNFIEKRADAPTMPGDPSRVLASMGNYVFSRELLIDLINEDAADPYSSHDFGKDILPKVLDKVDMFAYDFETNRIEGDLEGRAPYWRDVGTLDAYYEANMDVRAVDPPLNLYNRNWRIHTAGYADPPVKFVFDDDGRRGQAHDSLIAGGTIISGSTVKRSVLGRWVRIHSHALVEDCVLFDGVEIGRRAKVRRAIIEKRIRIPDDAVIGYDLDEDRKRYHVTESGIVVIGGTRSPVPITRLAI